MNADTRVPLDRITESHHLPPVGIVHLGRADRAPEVWGYVETWAGAPIAEIEDLDGILDALGVVLGHDGTEEIEEDGTVFLPLHELWPDDDQRWSLTPEGHAAIGDKA